jgi:hypothetical protein
MFAFPSPDDSERIPGIVQKISAVERGALCSTCFTSRVVIETLDFTFALGETTPVTTISSRFCTLSYPFRFDFEKKQCY